MSTCGFIYKIVFPNGKHYIGLTTISIEQRTNEHKKCAKYGVKYYLYNAIRKYNMIDNIELIEIDTSDNVEELKEKEIRYIQEYNSYYMNGRGYNMTYGGDGVNGYIYTEDVKQKMSEARIKFFENNPDEIQKMRERSKQYYENNPDAGKEHGERMKQHYINNPEARQKASETSTTQFESHESRQKMSEIKKQQYKDNPELLQKMSETTRKYFEDTPGAREKHGEALKIFHISNPKAGKEQGKKLKQHYINNPEARVQLSEKKKKYIEGHPEVKYKKLDTQGLNKPFDVCKSDGLFIKTFTYQCDAREYLHKEHDIKGSIKIGEVLSGKITISKGFVFKYK